MYMIVRKFFNGSDEVIKTGLTLKEAKEHCSDPESSSKTCSSYDAMERTRRRGPWFDSFTEE